MRDALPPFEPWSPPASIGLEVAEIDTPALLVDLDAFEHNLDHMDRTLAGTGMRVRPHAKSHKCPEIARRQVARGAVGVCCQKVSEAECLVAGGIADVLVTNEVVGHRKLERLAQLARRARVGVCVDDPGNVQDLGRAAMAAGAVLDVLVEIDVGAGRCGVAPGSPAGELARIVASTEGLRFAGLQAYHGTAQHLRTPAERQEAIAQAVAKAASTARLLHEMGLEVPVVTGAGTGTYPLEAGSGVYQELQPGSYVFMDADYGRNLGEDGLPVHGFQQSLFLLTTVMSRPDASRVVVDAGLKAHSVDSGMPLVAGLPGAAYTRVSDEHGVIELGEGPEVRLGEKLRLVPGHCDPTVNLHDWLVCVRAGRVVDLWPVSARGAFR